MTIGTDAQPRLDVSPAPLAGVTVVDFTRILSGPYATMLLADLGADVIKIERPDGGDDTRGWGPPFWRGFSTYFAAINRGKRSIALDLGVEEGRELARELIDRADVVVENFRPGVTGRLGIAYEDVRSRNPSLVYASITGFGSSGPRAGQAGTEVIVEAESGLMAMMGQPDGPPVRFGVAMVDIATGMALVNGVLAALMGRSRTGEGRLLEFPLYATAISVLGTVIASASVAPETQAGRFGSGHPSIVPYAAFEASDGWAVLGGVNEPMWVRLCEALELPALLEDERCATNELRVANRAYVDESIGAAVRDLTVAELVRRLDDRGVLVAPVRPAADAIEDPQVAVLGLLEDDEGVRFARTPLASFNPTSLGRAPRLGEHSRAVLGELGCSPDRIDGLLKAHVIDEPSDSREPART
jgi:crotonobetainyl-CoA:carnitine CoA-transferase CaiB-like acyl-CoA transferase